MHRSAMALSMSGRRSLSTVAEARLYSRLARGRLRCDLCHRRCAISDGERGYCGTRENRSGTLYTLVYGDLSCVESRPIEIKPFYHYWPGSTAMTFSTWSCNFDCAWCQNHRISRRRPDGEGLFHPPEELLARARAHGDQGLCASFQEPTLGLEYALDLFKMGSRMRLYACFVSNGYMTPQALELLARSGMDGIKIDLKGPKEVYRDWCGGVLVERVLESMETARKLGMHVEVVNLVVTGVNDGLGQMEWVIDRHLSVLGEDAPLHFTRYHPAHRYRMPPVPVSLLEEAVGMARRKGVRHAYVGNVPGHRLESTYCPECGALAIKRTGYRVTDVSLDETGHCSRCGALIQIVGKLGRTNVSPEEP